MHYCKRELAVLWSNGPADLLLDSLVKCGTHQSDARLASMCGLSILGIFCSAECTFKATLMSGDFLRWVWRYRLALRVCMHAKRLTLIGTNYEHVLVVERC